jgi:hypothetical protein
MHSRCCFIFHFVLSRQYPVTVDATPPGQETETSDRLPSLLAALPVVFFFYGPPWYPFVLSRCSPPNCLFFIIFFSMSYTGIKKKDTALNTAHIPQDINSTLSFGISSPLLTQIESRPAGNASLLLLFSLFFSPGHFPMSSSPQRL